MTREEFMNEVMSYKAYKGNDLTDENISLETATILADSIENGGFFTYDELIAAVRKARGIDND